MAAAALARCGARRRGGGGGRRAFGGGERTNTHAHAPTHARTHAHTRLPRAWVLRLLAVALVFLDVESRGLAWPLPLHLVRVETLTPPSSQRLSQLVDDECLQASELLRATEHHQLPLRAKTALLAWLVDEAAASAAIREQLQRNVEGRSGACLRQPRGLEGRLVPLREEAALLRVA